MASASAAHCKMNDEVWYLHTVNQWHHEKNCICQPAQGHQNVFNDTPEKNQ